MARGKTSKTYMYYRISYSKSRDSYSTWVYVGSEKYPAWDDFGLELEAKCVRAFDEEAQAPVEPTHLEPDPFHFIHLSILTGIRQALRLGYTIEFYNRPEEDK